MKPDEPVLLPLTNGMFATVDRRDYDRVAAYRWAMQLGTDKRPLVRQQLPYAAEQRNGKGQYGAYLHRFILGVENPWETVRFRNSNKLDCTRENMYVISYASRKPNPRRRGPAERPEAGPNSFQVPCGEIRPAKAMTRCTGFRPEGTSDGCLHYENCMDIAAKQLWEGFTATCGRRDTKEWKYVDGLEAHLGIIENKKIGYK